MIIENILQQKPARGRNPLLELCPFCGEAAEMDYDDKRKLYKVKCSNEECLFRPESDFIFQSEELAIKAWNTRKGGHI